MIRVSIVFFLINTLIFGCKPVDPCFVEDDFSVKLGDTVFIKACDENAEIYEWQLNKEGVNTFLNPPDPFFNHFADSGGTSCDPFISIILQDTGKFQVRCYFGKLSNGGCSDDLPMRTSEYLNATINVRDTVR